MWAAQQSHYYVIHLLLQYGADPLVTDVKGFNILHLATCEGNVFLLVILLHQNIPVDTRDAQGHTSLMWAAYTGFPACVDLFLRWGADVHATDENGLTALHWALVKGNPGCIQKLVEYGADRLALSLTGETPTMMAEKMKTDHIWRRVLTECGYEADGTPIKFGLPSFFGDRRTFTIRFFYFLPFVIIWVMLMILSQMSVYVAVPLSLFTGYILMYLGQKLLMFAPLDMKQIHKTVSLSLE
jgi:palmitoyltransferase